MKPYHTIVLPCLITLFLSGCAENPADKVSRATVDPAPAADASAKAATAAPTGEKTTFVLAKTGKIEWTGSKVTGSHNGGFSNFVGKFEIADSQLVAGGKHFVTIDMASVFSDDPRLTDHLKTAEFFDVVKYPISRFQIKEAVLKEGDKYEISGILDLHGTAKKITFPATLKFSGKETLLDMSAEFSINRKDFGIVYPGKPDDLIRDEVVLKFTVSAMPGEPQELVLMDKTAESNPEGGRFGGKGGPDGKGWGKGGPGGPGGVDWRNMTEAEREARRKQMMVEMDKNQDGHLGKDEMPERVWTFMSRADKDGDEKLSEKERNDFRDTMRAERELRELTGEGPPGFPGRPEGDRPRPEGDRPRPAPPE